MNDDDPSNRSSFTNRLHISRLRESPPPVALNSCCESCPHPVSSETAAAVIHRKVSLGTQSQTGERFAERALSAAGTCRLQHRSLFTYLNDLIAAHNRGDPFPTLA